MTGVQAMPKITAQEAARITGYTAHNIRKLARAGIVQAERFGRMWMLDEDAIHAYVAQMRALGSAKHTPRRYRPSEETQEPQDAHE